MPAGCDFICENTECPHSKGGFVMTGQWPMGKISLVINLPQVKKLKSFRDELVKMRDKGRKYACINYPNINEISTEAYRIQKWCKRCSCLWSYDVILDEDAKTFEEALPKADIPEKCPSCDKPLLDFEDVLEEGISCPHCEKVMEQNRWFSNE